MEQDITPTKFICSECFQEFILPRCSIENISKGLRSSLCEKCLDIKAENVMKMTLTTPDERLAKKELEGKKYLEEAYYQIIEFLDSWMDMPIEQKKIVAIWVIGTYFHKDFNTFPYLFFNAAKGSGKTRLLRIISYLQHKGNGEVLTNPSEAVIFRTAKERGLILDEFESEKSKDKQSLREYLNACYKQGGVVYRMEKTKNKEGKEVQEAVGHKLFTPIAMANINGIEDVLGDRAISVVLEKSNNYALTKKIEDFSNNSILSTITTKIREGQCRVCSVESQKKVVAGWNNFISAKYTSLHSLHTIHNYTYTTQEEDIYTRIDKTDISGRNLEIFFPILITAQMINESMFSDILEIVTHLNRHKKDEEYAESKDVSLIEFVSQCESYRYKEMFVHELLNEFKTFVGHHGEEDEKWINSNWLGLALKRLKLEYHKKRVAKGMLVLLNIDKAKEKIKMFKHPEELKDGNN